MCDNQKNTQKKEHKMKLCKWKQPHKYLNKKSLPWQRIPLLDPSGTGSHQKYLAAARDFPLEQEKNNKKLELIIQDAVLTAGASSIIFWCLLCTLQSLSFRCRTFPCLSPNIQVIRKQGIDYLISGTAGNKKLRCTILPPITRPYCVI